MNVARASLDELLLDYEDYLRQRGKRQWDKNDPEALAVRAVGRQLDQTDQTDRADPVAHWKAYARWLEHADDPAVKKSWTSAVSTSIVRMLPISALSTTRGCSRSSRPCARSRSWRRT